MRQSNIPLAALLLTLTLTIGAIAKPAKQLPHRR
jgi:hypothetical protein